jgi:hypothetical protein
VKATTLFAVFIAGLIVAAPALASDVDNLFPLRGLFFGLILLAIVVPMLPMVPIAAVAALYALFVERRRALGTQTVLLASISVAALAVLHLKPWGTDGSVTLAVLAGALAPLPVVTVLLWRGMVRQWTPSQTSRGTIVAAVVGAAAFIGELAYLKAATEIPPPVLDAGFAARRCNGLIYDCAPFSTSTVPIDVHVDACVAAFPVCQTPEPWNEAADCCPAACLASYAEERASPSPARAALRVAFHPIHECHPGVHDDFRARGHKPLPIEGRRTTPRAGNWR